MDAIKEQFIPVSGSRVCWIPHCCCHIEDGAQLGLYRFHELVQVSRDLLLKQDIFYILISGKKQTSTDTDQSWSKEVYQHRSYCNWIWRAFSPTTSTSPGPVSFPISSGAKTGPLSKGTPSNSLVAWGSKQRYISIYIDFLFWDDGVLWQNIYGQLLDIFHISLWYSFSSTIKLDHDPATIHGKNMGLQIS